MAGDDPIMGKVAEKLDEEYSGEPLTALELRHLRRIMEAQKRADWVWSSMRVVAVWIAAVIAAVYGIGKVVVDVVGLASGKGQ
jgi:hypothetical protein